MDAYIPIGKDLYYYSLYPFVMAERPMPAGKPVWRGSLALSPRLSITLGGPLGLPYREVYFSEEGLKTLLALSLRVG